VHKLAIRERRRKYFFAMQHRITRTPAASARRAVASQ
jgi:hypothetical protein